MSEQLPTREDFEAYEEVRKNGDFNMFTSFAQEATGLDRETYRAVQKNYIALCRKYPMVRTLP